MIELFRDQKKAKREQWHKKKGTKVGRACTCNSRKTTQGTYSGAENPWPPGRRRPQSLGSGFWGKGSAQHYAAPKGGQGRYPWNPGLLPVRMGKTVELARHSVRIWEEVPGHLGLRSLRREFTGLLPLVFLQVVMERALGVWKKSTLRIDYPWWSHMLGEGPLLRGAWKEQGFRGRYSQWSHFQTSCHPLETALTEPHRQSDGGGRMGLVQPGLSTIQQHAGLELRGVAFLHLEPASSEGMSMIKNATVHPINAVFFFRNTISTQILYHWQHSPPNIQPKNP